MFWDGERWIEERQLPARRASVAKARFRHWGAAGVALAVVATLALTPPEMASARTPADLLLARWSDDSITQVFQERAPAVSASRAWNRVHRPAAMGGHHLSTRQEGARVAITFDGSAIAVVGPRGPGRGKARVFVDGKLAAVINLHANKPISRQVLFTQAWRDAEKHVVALEVVGTSGHPRVTVDAFVVRGGKRAKNQSPAPTPTPGPVEAPAEPTPTGAPDPTATPAPAAPTAQPTAAPTPTAVPATPAPTAQPTAAPTPTAVPATPAPTAQPTAAPTPTAVPATPAPTATPTPAASCGSSLQAKVDAASSGSTLNLTGCTYPAGATINKSLTLVGARINPPANTRGLIVTASNVTVDSVVITGSQATTYRWNEVGILTTGSISNLVVRSSTLQRFGNTGIWLGPTTNARITGNTIEDAVYAGIMDIAGSRDRIDNNVVRRIGVVGASANGNNAYGIAISNDGGTLSADIVVDGNTVATVPTWHGLDTHAGQRITFSNNTVSGSPRALFITSDSYGRSAAAITVTGNRFLSPLPATTNLDIVTTYDVDGVTITGNTASGWGGSSFLNDYLGMSTGIVMSGNSITP